jgi:hypothetical protein
MSTQKKNKKDPSSTSDSKADQSKPAQGGKQSKEFEGHTSTKKDGKGNKKQMGDESEIADETTV